MTAHLQAEGICLKRGKRLVLNDVSVRILPGQLWALIGPNGAGKSSLLEVLLGSLPVEGGSVSLSGQPQAHLSRRARAQHMALIGRELPQNIPLDVRALVELGRLPHQSGRSLGEADHRAVEAALREADCLEFASRPLFSLSDGERQRAHFARALAQAPKVLLLDEATAHLDLVHRERTLIRTKQFCASGGSALAVLHDLDLAVRHATHLAVLEKGRLIASGLPQTVLTGELLRRVFEVEAEVQVHERGPSLRIYGVAP